MNGRPELQDLGGPGASTWTPVPLEPVLAGTAAAPQPALLERTDGIALLYPGELHLAIGEPESAKGWLALHATAERLAAGDRVVLVDFEDSAPNIIARLRLLDVDPAAIASRFVYIRPDEALTGRARADLHAALLPAPALVVLDGLTEAFALQGHDPDNNRQAADWLNTVPRPIQAATGAAILMVDHVTKSREGRGRYPIGAQHKLAGVAAAFALDVITPLGRGRDGTAKVTVVKDRHGALREHAGDGRQIALLHVRSVEDRVTVTLEPPTPGDADADRAAFRPTTLMERVSKAVEQEPGLTRNAIRSAIKGKAEYVDLALDLLVAEGFIDKQRDGQAHRHTSLNAYRAQDDEPTESAGSRPGPRRVQDPLPGTGSPESLPLQGDSGQDPAPPNAAHTEPSPKGKTP